MLSLKEWASLDVLSELIHCKEFHHPSSFTLNRRLCRCNRPFVFSIPNSLLSSNPDDYSMKSTWTSAWLAKDLTEYHNWSSAMSLQTFSWTSDEELINESSPQLPLQKPIRLSLLLAKITDVLMSERKRSLIRKFPHSCSFNLMAVFVALTKSSLHAWFVFWCTKQHQYPPASDIKYLPRPFLFTRALCHFISPLTTSMFKEALGFSEVWLLVSQGISCFRSSKNRRCLPVLFRRKWINE